MKLSDVSVFVWGRVIADGWRCFVSRVPFGRGWLRGGGLYGLCSVCLTGSLSCQHWVGITCSPVSERQ